jgi:hypothetical protein
VALLGQDGGALLRLGVGVETEQNIEVLERVLLLAGVLDGALGGANGGLDLIGVDDAGNVGVVQDGMGEAACVKRYSSVR